MKRSHFYSLGLGVLLLGFVPSNASAFTLDLFTDGNDVFPNTTVPYQKVQVDTVFNQVSASNLDTGLSGVAWGQRQLDITASSSFIGSAKIEIFGNPSTRATISSDDSVTINTALFTWGFDSNTEYQDITDGGTDNVFNLQIISIDQNGADIKFTVTDNAGERGSVTVENITSTGAKSFAYSDILTNNPNVNLGGIKKVQMEVLNAPTSFDGSFDFIESANDPFYPEVPVPFEFSPSLGILLCGGFFGVYKLRQKLQKN